MFLLLLLLFISAVIEFWQGHSEFGFVLLIYAEVLVISAKLRK
jgi:hypothetical protein